MTLESRTGEEAAAAPPALATAADRLPGELPRWLLACALAIVAAIPVAYVARTLPNTWITTFFFVDQDLPVLAAEVAFLGMLASLKWPGVPPALWQALMRRQASVTLAAAALVLAAAGAGTFLVFHRFNLSRDEVMADFDARILQSGRLIAEVAPQWRHFVYALVPNFLLPVPGDVAWISSYLPVNAGLRALTAFAVDPGLVNPVLAGLSLLLIFDVARALWPDRRDAVLVAVLLLATSSQLVITAMMGYAMTGHLLLNLIWLRLFLRGGRLGHGGAIAAGFLACGLHQLVFHPLFVAPFILHLWSERRRALALGYGAAYLVIGAFWIGYWQLLLTAAGIASAQTADVGFGFFLHRAMSVLGNLSLDGIALMLRNLLRFAAWQNPILLPLLAGGMMVARRGRGLSGPLAGGVVLTLLTMLVLMAFQGYGWGYRYLHGLLGNICLLAGYGWIAATGQARPGQTAAARTAFGLSTALALAVMLPLHLMQAEAFMAPYRIAVETIARARSDIVIVDGSGLRFAADLVRNDPLLQNTPKVMDLTFLDEQGLRDLCGRFAVSVFDRRQALRLGIPERPDDPPEEQQIRERLRAYMAGLSCGTGLAIPSVR
jgi:hypothetical protein